MLRTSDGETEILLGNKQLLGIFFVVVILLGVAFAGGYKIGQGSKKPGFLASTGDQPATSTSTGPGETHSVPAEGAPASANSSSDGSISPTSERPPQTEAPPPASPAETAPAQTTQARETPLGSHSNAGKTPKSAPAEDPEAAGPPPPVPSRLAFTPQPGQMFLQVAAVGRDEAEAIADVLRKKNFHAHAVPKPGSTKLYRVIIGPVRDASDLSSTRTALRNTGFREIIVQKY
jgi:cell division septation protein DedD